MSANVRVQMVLSQPARRSPVRPSTVAVIVGAGHAGGRAAETLRTVGWNGAIVLIGNENHLPYERPPLSKDVLTGRSSIATADVVPPSFYQDAHIDVRLRSSVTEIDTRNGSLHLSDGGTLRSEEHTSELESVRRSSYAGVWLKDNIVTKGDER